MSRLSEPRLYARVHQLVRIYGLKHFAETGIGPEMDGLRTATALRLTLSSCDINGAFVEAARGLFGVVPRTETTCSPKFIAYGESLSFIEDVCYHIKDDPTLWFLDAHFPEYEDYGNAPENAAKYPRFPLLDELKAIRKHKAGFERDVILCDDMRCIEDLLNPRWDPKEMKDSPLVQPGPLSQYTDVFADTHNWTVWTEFEGVLAFTPRGE